MEKSQEIAEHAAALLRQTDIHFADSKDHVTMNEIDYMHLDEDGHKQMAAFMQQQIMNVYK